MDALRSTAARDAGAAAAPCSTRAGRRHRAYWVANMIWVRGDREPGRGARRARGRVPRLRQPARRACAEPVERAGRRAPDVARRDRVERRAGPRARGLGARLHRPGRRRRRRRTPATSGTTPRSRASTAAGTAPRPTTTTTGTTRSTRAAASAAPTRPRPATTSATARTRWARWSATTAARNQIGVAPGAKWIGCRNMDQGVGTPATYTECFQWFIAPTDLADQNPDPSKAPHVINNSWGCPPSEGCTIPTSLQTVVENTRAAGIVVVVSAGNAGSRLQHGRTTPPAIYDASFSRRRDRQQRQHRGLLEPRPGHGRRQQPPEARRLRARASTCARACRAAATRVFSGTSMAGPARRRRRRARCSRPIPTSSATRTRSSRVLTALRGAADDGRDLRRRPGQRRSPTTPTAGAASTRSSASSQRGPRDHADRRRPIRRSSGVPVTYTLTVTNHGPGRRHRRRRLGRAHR